jgi:hypothetical protein
MQAKVSKRSFRSGPLNHRENIEKFGSCPLRCKTLVFPGFFAFLANCFGVLVRPCWLGAWRRAALDFASRTENRVVFRVALGRQNTGVLHGPVWYRSTPVEAVGFELSV